MTTPANLCGPSVARLRRKNDFTQAELRQRCQLAGWNVARSVLAKVENRSRSVSDFELVALARALGVPVPHLLRPLPVNKPAKKTGRLRSRHGNS